jgi:uncharacterized RDD family membrane protein YckC
MARATAVPVSGSKLDNRRVLAALIDIAIIGAGYALILAAAGKLGDPGAGGALTAVGIGWALYYYFACESGDGQTVGKRVMKLRVVRTNGGPAGMREVGLRTILRVIDGLFLYLVGLIVMLATRERRGRLGDLIGGTMIVSAEQPARSMDMSAPEAPAAVSRVPIAESGRAFESASETEVEVEVERPDEQPDVASPSLKELASDVSAVTEDPEREVEEEEPEVEELPAAEAEPVADEPVADEPVAQAETEEEPAEEPEEEEPAEELEDEEREEAVEELDAEAQEADADEEVTVKSVETVSAIDLVMEGDDEEAVAGPQSKARQS